MGKEIFGEVDGFGGVFLESSSDTDEEMERLQEGLEARGMEVGSVNTGEGYLLHDSSSQAYSEDGNYVVFNGHLRRDQGTDISAAEYCLNAYRQYGKSFPEHIEGSFRVALYDAEDQILHLARDRPGSLPIFYAPLEKGIIFASHITSMLAPSSISQEIDRQSVRDYFLSGTEGAFSRDATLIQGVKQMNPSEHLLWNGSVLETWIYWDPLADDKRDVSDQEAVERTKDLLEESAESLVRRHGEKPKLLFTGGTDSTILAAFMDQASEKGVETYTFGETDERAMQGQRPAEILNVPNEPVKLPSELLPPREVWKAGQPTDYLAMFRLTQLPLNGLDHCYTGITSSATFPVQLQRYRKLERFRKFSAVAKALYYTGLDQKISGLPPANWRLETGVDILSSPYRSTAITTAWRDGRKRISQIIGVENRDNPRAIEEAIDQRWSLDRRRLDELVAYLKFREGQTPFISADIAPYMEHHDLFGYTPLVSYQFELPMDQRKQRRILRTVMKEVLPERMVERLENRSLQEAGGSNPLLADANHHLEANWDEYRSLVEGLDEREFMAAGGTTEYLLPESVEGCNVNRKMNMMKAYMLERWIRTLLEREKPWEHP